MSKPFRNTVKYKHVHYLQQHLDNYTISMRQFDIMLILTYFVHKTETIFIHPHSSCRGNGLKKSMEHSLSVMEDISLVGLHVTGSTEELHV